MSLRSQGIFLISFWVVNVVIIIIYFALYYEYYDIFNRKRPSKSRLVWKSYYPEAIGEDSYKGTEDYLIKTAGCYIPNYAKTLQFEEAFVVNKACGLRAIFVDKNGDNITFRIDEEIMKTHRKGRTEEYTCCYRFVSRLTIPGREETGISYSSCMGFRNETTIKFEQEALDVSCVIVPYKKIKRIVIYKDAYMMVKKIQIDLLYNEDKQKSWNVLVLGIDTMSRARLISSMPHTFSFLKHRGWIDYKGYQKVGSHTFPNIMAFLTGMNPSSVYTKCRAITKIMDICNDDIMWSKYKKAGYVTAYGEDNVQLPDTFMPRGFTVPPTTHYMRPLYLTGETIRGNFLCTKQVASATSALNYALDFVETYKNDKFFALFWINSYSHNLFSSPTLLDKYIVNFYEKLTSTGALSNTFIFFISDHGIRYGKMKLPIESYYEERLPMFFMWTPTDFQKSHRNWYHNLKINQNRLTTPYDLHETFRSILQLSSGVVTGERSEACPTCTSLFEVKPVHRTCASANVDEKWCSCRNLTYLHLDKKTYEYGAVPSIDLAVSYIQNLTKNIKTKNCTKCYLLQLKKVLRAHKQVDYVKNLTNYVIAFKVSPGGLVYEAFVQEDEKGFHQLLHTQSLSPYNNNGKCIVRAKDREYCVCQTLAKCN